METTLYNASMRLKEYAHYKMSPYMDPKYIDIDAQRDAALKPVYFIYEDDHGFFYHAFHQSKIPGTIYSDIQSPYGYGGPFIISDNASFHEAAWRAYCDFCLEQGIVVEFIRFHPLLDNWQYFQGDVLPNRETVWVDLTPADLIATYEVRARTAIRKALKNQIEINEESREFFCSHFKKLYEQTMLNLQAEAFYHFNEQYIESICAWENALLLVARHEGQVVSAAIFLEKDNFLEYHLSASTPIGKKLSANNLLLHEAFLIAKARGCTVAHLGGGNSSDDNNPLLFFKQGFSDKKASYKIGKYIHNPAVYQELKIAWEKSKGRKPTKILFYKDEL